MSDHIVSPRIYIAVFLSLMALTAITVWVAYFDLGTYNTVVAMAIAALKATLVLLYFMHVRYSNKLIWIVLGNGLFWLLVLFALTMSDYVSRGWLPFPGK